MKPEFVDHVRGEGLTGDVCAAVDEDVLAVGGFIAVHRLRDFVSGVSRPGLHA
jgi:hypothetical protein